MTRLIEDFNIFEVLVAEQYEERQSREVLRPCNEHRRESVWSVTELMILNIDAVLES